MNLTQSRSGIFALPSEDFAKVAVAENHVLARYFSGIHEVIRLHGADPEELISTFDIDPSVFHEPSRQIACARALPLVEECSLMLDIPYLGLELANSQGVDAYGYVSILCRTAPNLQSARSRPRTWCKNRESWLGWAPAQLTTADNRAV